MILGVLRLMIEIPEAESLKDKRSVVLSLKSRIESRFKVSIAEVGSLGNHNLGELGIAVVSNDSRHADEVMNRVANFAVENVGSGFVSDIHTEIVNFG